ncbi:MAG: DUF6529 family protein [Gaiellaceae bacterium]
MILAEGLLRRPGFLLGAALLAGGLVAVLAGVYGSVHDPASETTVQWFFSTTLHMKAWMTTLAVIFGLAQVVSALWLYGRLPFGKHPAWLGSIHRSLGSLALLASIPVAYHCLWALGFEGDIGESRRFWHSVFGCAFYGAFATKVLVVRSRSMPSWALPVVGGALFTILVVVWLTSSLWFFDNIGVEF